jgi:hypothetical protein
LICLYLEFDFQYGIQHTHKKKCVEVPKLASSSGIDEQPQIIACLVTYIGVIVENDLQAELNEPPNEHRIENSLQPGDIVIIETLFLNAGREKHTRCYKEQRHPKAEQKNIRIFQ